MPFAEGPPDLRDGLCSLPVGCGPDGLCKNFSLLRGLTLCCVVYRFDFNAPHCLDMKFQLLKVEFEVIPKSAQAFFLILSPLLQFVPQVKV